VPEAWRERVSAYVPYDGAGRYTIAEEDGVRGVQGLAALASRFGAKPYDQLRQPDGTWQTERVIFRDVDTGTTVVRLTNDPWADELSYFQGNWSADGRYVVFRRRPGMWESSTETHGPMAVGADGTGLRNVFRDYPMVRKQVCSPTAPAICYALAADKKLVAFDLETGRTHHVVRDVLGSWHLKVSLDGKYLMSRSAIEKGGQGLWIVSADGSEYYELSIPEAIHDSYQFHPSQRKVMYWYEGRYRTEGFVQCNFDGSDLTKVPVLFDWNHGDVGPDRGVHTEGYITRIQGGTWGAKEELFQKPGVEYYDDPADYNGYLTWWPKDRLWVSATRILKRPYISELQAFYAEPAADGVVNRYRICFTGLQRPASLDNPGASPDGTKVLFNSNVFGRVDAYCAVARLPERPRALSAAPASRGVTVTWTPPAHHAEMRGYHVYRSRESGVNFEPLTMEPVSGTEFVDESAAAGATFFYAVTSVEHSGLESALSDEVAVGAGPGTATARRLFLEAEDGERTHQMWLALQGLASNLQYVWMRTKEGEGVATFDLSIADVSGPWRLWARVRGREGARFVASVAGSSARLEAPASDEWRWVQAEGTLDLKPGRQQLRLSSTTYGSAADALCLTSDAAFSPEGEARIRWPEQAPVTGLAAEATSPYAVRLSWKPVGSPSAGGSPLLRQYNLYCGSSPGFAPDQSTLIGSPDRESFLDWGLKPAQALYYRVTWVNRGGEESPPSEAVKVVTPAIERVTVEREPGAQVTFEVPRKDTYVLWLKLKQGRGEGSYITVKVDETPGRTWTCAFDSLSDDSWFTYDQWGRFDLEPGRHVLTIENKTAHTVEKVLFTNDLSLAPEGHVNILSGW